MQSSPRKQRESGIFKEVWIAYNNLIEYCRAIAVQQAGSTGVKVDQRSNGTILRVEIPEAESVAGKVVRMRVDTVGMNHLTCHNYEDGSQVQVAKPFNLRSANWHAQTILYALENYPTSPGNLSITYAMVSSEYRTATIGTFTEHQVIRPKYVAGFSEIFAAQCENTGLPGIDWVDLNADARAWTMVL